MANNMKNGNKPQSGTYYDEADREGERLYKVYQSDRSQFELLSKAAELYENSKNPEAKQIALLLHGFYFHEAALNEKNNEKAVSLLSESLAFFEKASGSDSIETKRVKLTYLKRKIQLSENTNVSRAELFLEMANIHKELDDTKNYHIEMSMYYMFSMLALEPFDKKLTDYAELMVVHATESGNKELLYKTKVLLHGVKSAVTPDPVASAKELEKSLKFIQQTSDRFGEEETKAKLVFTKGMATAVKPKRDALFREAASTWIKLGDKEKAVSALKLLLPVPVNVSVMLKVADKSLENHLLLGKKIQELITIKPGPYALFHHHSHLIERIKDVKNIITRLGENRKELTNLSIRENALGSRKVKAGHPLPKKLQVLLNKKHKLTELMKLDMESLYIFGNLLLDQWSYMIAYLIGINDPHFFTFHKLYELMSSDNDKGLLSSFWAEHRKDIFWLYYQLRSYRNIFIEHVRRPWQRGNTMSVYGDDFNLFIPTPPGWVDAKKIDKDLRSIFHLAPKALRDAPDDYWEKKNLHRVLEVTFRHIDDIDEKKDREKVWDVWKVVGGSTPSYEIIGYRLLNFVATSVPTIIDIISGNPGKINLGKIDPTKTE